MMIYIYKFLDLNYINHITSLNYLNYINYIKQNIVFYKPICIFIKLKDLKSIL